MITKKLILTSLALMSLTVANSQTVNTTVGTSGSEKKIMARPALPSPDARAERSSMRMKNELTLNDEQYTKLLALKKEKYAAIKVVADKYPSSDKRDARVAELKPIRDSYVTSLNAILTPEQLTKHKELTQMRFDNWKKVATAQANAPKVTPEDEEEQQIKIDLE